MSALAQVGDFCPNETCPDYGKRQVDLSRKNIRRNGKTTARRQRFKCTTCGQTFTETKGTLFYRKRTPQHEILESLAFLCEGNRVSSVARVKHHKEDTIAAWLREAADHANALEDILLAEFKVKRAQLDGLWSYVRNKGEKTLP